jgi:hypothetical protein
MQGHALLCEFQYTVQQKTRMVFSLALSVPTRTHCHAFGFLITGAAGNRPVAISTIFQISAARNLLIDMNAPFSAKPIHNLIRR